MAQKPSVTHRLLYSQTVQKAFNHLKGHLKTANTPLVYVSPASIRQRKRKQNWREMEMSSIKTYIFFFKSQASNNSFGLVEFCILQQGRLAEMSASVGCAGNLFHLSLA